MYFNCRTPADFELADVPSLLAFSRVNSVDCESCSFKAYEFTPHGVWVPGMTLWEMWVLVKKHFPSVVELWSHADGPAV